MLQPATPMLYVRDVRAAIDYYPKLGFEVVETDEQWQGPGVVHWAKLAWGNARVMVASGGSGTPVCDVTLYFACDDLDAVYQQVRAHVDVTHEPKRQHYGVRDFWCTDRFGFQLAFGEPV